MCSHGTVQGLQMRVPHSAPLANSTPPFPAGGAECSLQGIERGAREGMVRTGNADAESLQGAA